VRTIDLTELLQRSEGETLDFKGKQYPSSSDEEKSKLLIDILAMANVLADEDRHILIGVEEEDGNAKQVCGADTTIKDSNLQQLVKSKTNRPVLFRLEVQTHDGKNVTVIQIDKEQQRPIYLKNSFGLLKNYMVYGRHGSGNVLLTPDEIIKMDRDEKSKVFWEAFKVFLKDTERRTSYLHDQTKQHIYDTTIAERRLNITHSNTLLNNSSEIYLDAEFRSQLTELVNEMRAVDEYMNFGAEKLGKSMANFNNAKNSLHELVSKMAQVYLK
jgi:hypothetical protein